MRNDGKPEVAPAQDAPDLPWGPGALAEKMGIRLVEATPERMVGTMPVEGNTQPFGLLHGGAHLVLAETLGSVGAALWALSRNPDRPPKVVGIEIGASHLGAASAGRVTGVATAVHLGRTLVTYAVEMRGDDGRLLSTARITNLVLD